MTALAGEEQGGVGFPVPPGAAHARTLCFAQGIIPGRLIVRNARKKVVNGSPWFGCWR